MYMMYYVSMIRYWQLIRILVGTKHPCLRVGRHRWYQRLTSIIPHWRPYFQKPMVRIRLNAHIRTIVVLTGGKLTVIYFPHLLSVMTHQWEGKKVSILQSGDVNPGPIPSRWGLLQDSPYRVVGAAVHHVTSRDRAPMECGDLGMSCGDLRKAWIHSCNVCSAVHATLNAWAPLGDKWWCMTYMCIVFLSRYANHDCVS
jgi:hypothetical protein